MIPSGIAKELTSMMQTWLMNEVACPPAVRQEPDNTLNLLDIDFWLWYQKVTPKGMAHAFKIKFWEMFSTSRYYDILTEGQYKMPNSNDGCMWLRVPTACPEWNEGTDKDVKIFQWLSIHAVLTSECISEVIEPFTRWQTENAMTGATWNEATKLAAERQVKRPPPCPAKVAEPNTVSLSSSFKQYTLFGRLADAEAQSKPLDNAMVIDKPAKLVAGSSKHPDVIDSKLIY